MTDFRRQAECVKLARLLHTSPESLDCLDDLDNDELHALRHACNQYLLRDHHALFQRIASASKLLPASLSAFISERAMGPLLCARIASEMSPPRAVAISQHLPPAFMAATAIYLDPEKASALTAALPLQNVLAVSRELVAKKEFITMGSLVDTLPFNIIQQAIHDLTDGEALLRIAFFIENPARLNQLLDTLPGTSLNNIIQAAADETTDLWPHAMGLMSLVNAQWQIRLVNMAADSGADTLSSMIRGVAKHKLWSTALPLLSLMSEAQHRYIINLPAFQNDAALRDILRSATDDDLWQFLLPLIPLMEKNLRNHAAKIADELSDDAIRHLVSVSHEKNMWHSALPFMEDMGIVRRAMITELVAESSDDAITSLANAVCEHQQWHLILPLLATMTEHAQRRFVSLPVFQEDKVLQDIIKATNQYELWPIIAPIVGFMPENSRRRVAHFYESFDLDSVRRWSESVDNAAHWQVTLELASYMHPERRGTLALLVAEQSSEVLNHLLNSLHESQHWQPLLTLLAELTPAAQHQVLARGKHLEPHLRAELLLAAEKTGMCDAILQRIAELPAHDQSIHLDVFLGLPEENIARLRQRCTELGIAALLDEE